MLWTLTLSESFVVCARISRPVCGGRDSCGCREMKLRDAGQHDCDNQPRAASSICCGKRWASTPLRRHQEGHGKSSSPPKARTGSGFSSGNLISSRLYPRRIFPRLRARALAAGTMQLAPPSCQSTCSVPLQRRQDNGSSCSRSRDVVAGSGFVPVPFVPAHSLM